MEHETYLGDAVYASFDGWHICLRTGGGNKQRIYLEPAVLNALSDFVAKIRQRTEDTGDAAHLDD